MAEESSADAVETDFAEVFAYFEETLDRPMPEFWKKLAEHAPYAMEGYYHMRQGVFTDPAESHIPRKYQELLVVAMDCAIHNRWGVEAHTRAAVKAGATMEEVTEAMVLSIMVLGMPNFRNMGYYALLAAEEAMEEYENETEGE
jgi:AhpD family alkylhydroperoxidase